MSRTRSVVRWIPATALFIVLGVSWSLFTSGGMRAVFAWSCLIVLGGTVAPLTILIVLAHAGLQRKFSRPMTCALCLAIVALWPGLWGFGFLCVRFPVSRESTGPSATVRLPANGPIRVAWGGDSVRVNHHASYPDQRWAYDLTIEPALSGSSRLEDYGCYGKTVVAPLSARVHSAIDDQPDETPGLTTNTKHPAGNSVVFALETGTYLIVAHLKPRSVVVHDGDWAEEGQPIGQCGNSGNTSEPHIHIHHQRQDPKGRPDNFSEGLPLYFRNQAGPAMPEGGIERHDHKLRLVGATVSNLE